MPLDRLASNRPLKQRALDVVFQAFMQRWPWIYRQPGGPEYGTVLPVANYMPWNRDPDFLGTYRAILKHTMVDIYRAWDLWMLSGQAAKCGGALLEVGVWRGGTGALIARSAAISGSTALVYLCDTFRGVVKAGHHDTFYKGGEHSDTSSKIVQDLLTSMDVNAQILNGIFPDETAHLIPPSTRFSFVHIDVDVYQSAKDILEWVWDRLQVGGVVVYDDYGFEGCEGISRHVNEQILSNDRIVLQNLNGHGVIVKIT